MGNNRSTRRGNDNSGNYNRLDEEGAIEQAGTSAGSDTHIPSTTSDRVRVRVRELKKDTLVSTMRDCGMNESESQDKEKALKIIAAWNTAINDNFDDFHMKNMPDKMKGQYLKYFKNYLPTEYGIYSGLKYIFDKTIHQPISTLGMYIASIEYYNHTQNIYMPADKYGYNPHNTPGELPKNTPRWQPYAIGGAVWVIAYILDSAVNSKINGIINLDGNDVKFATAIRDFACLNGKIERMGVIGQFQYCKVTLQAKSGDPHCPDNNISINTIINDIF